MGNFDDLIPANSKKKTSGNFDDLIPGKGQAVSKTKSRAEQQFGVNPDPLDLFHPTKSGLWAGGPSGLGITQPGASLPFVGQVAGNAAGGTVGPVGAMGGGITGALLGEGVRQKIGQKMGVQDRRQSVQQFGRVAKEAAVGEVMGLGLQGAVKLAKPAAGRLINSVIKPNVRQLMKGKNLGVEMAEQGIFGSEKGMLRKSEKLIEKSEQGLQQLLRESTGKVDITDTILALDDLENQYVDEASKNAIRSLKKDLLGSMGGDTIVDPSSANELKRRVYRSLKDVNYGTDEVGPKTKGFKVAGKALREGIEKATGDPRIKDLNKKIGVGARAADALERRLAQNQKNNIFGLTDAFLFGPPAAFGNPVLGGALVIGKKLLSSPQVKSGAAAGLAKFSKVPAREAAPVVGATVSQTLARLRRG